MSEVQLTIESVTKPNHQFNGSGALAGALTQQHERAVKGYNDVATKVLSRVASERATLAQRKSDLNTELDAITKTETSISRAITAAEVDGGTILPLAATVHMKEELMSYMRANNIVVPQSSSDVWKLPEA